MTNSETQGTGVVAAQGEYDVPDELKEHFQRLCEPFPEDYLLEMERHVREALLRLTNAGSPQQEPNYRAAIQLAEVCYQLIERFQDFSLEQKLLVIGAIRYFVMHLDSLPDMTPEIGFNDDALVMNHVLARLGLKQLFIQC